MQRTALSFAFLVAVAGCGDGDGPATPDLPVGVAPILPPAPAAWHVPACGSVGGAAPVTFTHNGGLHRVPIAAHAAANYFTYGVTALSKGSTLAAVVGTTTSGASAEIFFSTDAGCTWQPSGHTLPNTDYYLSAELTAAGDKAYVWSTANVSVHVIEPTGVMSAFDLTSFAPWVSGPYGLAVDPHNPARVRIGMYDCIHRASCGHGSVIMETTNNGATWRQIGFPAPYANVNMHFSPTNLDHVIAPGGEGAGHVTFDGGNLWLHGQGLPAGWYGGDAAISFDDQTVWMLASTGQGSPAYTRAMYVSHDGGLNYQQAFAASAENPFAARSAIDDPLYQVRMFPHASNPDIVYLAHTSPEGTSYLYRYDDALDELTKRQWPATEGGVWALAFNAADPDLLYLGLSAAE